MKTFNPTNWYWAVGGSTAQVYSSASNTYVALSDATFGAWRAAGGVPSQIASEADLWDVLAQAGATIAAWLFDGATFSQTAVDQYSKAQLSAYATFKRYAVETGGITVEAMPISTDRQSQAMINGAYNLVQLAPASSLQFKTDSGFVALNATQIIALATAVAVHVQKCFSAEASASAAIAAGTMTTPAEIDAAFVGA